jgi:hypothetical protein
MRTFQAVLLCAFLYSTTSAEIIEGNISLFRPGFFAEYQLLVFQDPEADDYTSIWFDFDGNSLIGRDSNLDEGSDWYLVPFGTEFTTRTILESNFPFLVKGSSDGGLLFGSVPIDLGSFYLGVNTGIDFDINDLPVRDVFGWAEFYNDGSSIQLIRSAVGYGIPGIVIGTTIAVPEPGSLSLILISLSTALFRWPASRRN